MANPSMTKNFSKGLLEWYDFREGSRILYVGKKEDALGEFLQSKTGDDYDEGKLTNKGLTVVFSQAESIFEDNFLEGHQNSFDYIITACVIEKCEKPDKLVSRFAKMLDDKGILLMFVNNRLGIRYFCGDRDNYTEQNFDGIDDYRRCNLKSGPEYKGRMYARHEILDMLDAGGFAGKRIYSVFPNLDNPTHLFAYDYLPNEDVTNRIFPTYHSAKTVFLEEEYIYPSLIENGMFHTMANAYLMECSKGDIELSHALQVTLTMDRSPEDSMTTIIYDDDTVEKRNLHPEGRVKLVRMMEYADDLGKHGIDVVPMELTPKGIKMPYINAPTGQLYLRRLIKKDKDLFLKALDEFYGIILRSSDKVEEDTENGMGITLKYGYPDMVPLNCFFLDNRFVFFDQEFREENYPANVMVMRMISMLYYGNPDFQKIITEKELYDRYNLTPCMRLWKQAEWRFLNRLRNEDDLRDYWNTVRRNNEISLSNKQRMNFPEDEYRKWFVDALGNADTRKLIIFGSGKYCRHYLEKYGKVFTPYAIVDNQSEKWGESLDGITISSPDLLKDLKPAEYKVLICIKDYFPVITQLQNMGVNSFSVYDPKREYRIVRASSGTDEIEVKKKYHIGYISGTFDLFHIGHLNMFKRAKELCDYLIVGVVTDEGTKKHKGGVVPFVPFEERIELVRACKYVDEAVEIPVDRNGPKEAYAMYHFDVQFNGTDHMYEPYWIEMQKYLREQGSDMVFFPYTLSTNSTNIKKLIEKKLI